MEAFGYTKNLKERLDSFAIPVRRGVDLIFTALLSLPKDLPDSCTFILAL